MSINNKEQILLKGLAANETGAIETIYRENYGIIQSFILKNSGYPEDARDIFQEAMIVLYEKTISGSFELSCQIKTYLYSVCRRLWLKKLQQLQRHSVTTEINEETIPIEEELEEHDKKNQDFILMEHAMEKIGEPCKSLLEAYYFEKKSMPEIADFFGYTNADNAKTQKYKCLMRLKKIFLHNIKMEIRMEDILLLDAIERYKNGQMSQEERIFLEELRKTNPEIDQLVVEHTFFLQQLENTAKIKDYRQSLNEVESKLINEGVIAKKQLKGKAKLVYLWNRSRRTIAVAASIAGIVSIFTAGMFTAYNKNKSEKIITPLVDYKFKQVDARLKQFEKKLNQASVPPVVPPVKPKIEAIFRATGFLIDVSGYLVTNAHVINNAKNLFVENKKGEQFSARPVYISHSSDLAILKIVDTSFKDFTFLPYSIRKSSAELGEQIFTLGYPRDEVVYGEGYLSAKSGYSGDTSSYQISISVNPGNSGGPVINKNGEVIGIISSKETNADGVVFAIKSKNIYIALEEIKKEEGIKLPVNGTIKGLERVQQIKKIEDCVFMVKGN